METVEEDIEIDYLLLELEKEGVDNVDWDSIGLDEDQVKTIVEDHRISDNDESSEKSSEKSSDKSSESSEEESSDDDDDDDMQHTVFSKPTPSTNPPATTANSDYKPPVKQTSTMAIKLAPAPPKPQPKLEAEEESSSEEEETDEESEEETDSD